MRSGTLALACAVAFALTTPTLAADLGGGCCQDLEERVAELEATAAKKGNRKVSLTVSGYVSHSVMYWDDGGMSDTYIGDGGAVSSRFRFVGKGKINADLEAGFLYEFGAVNNALGSMNQATGGDDLGGAITLRDSTVWLKHRALGMVKVGHGSTATDNLILVDVSGAAVAMSADVGVFNGAFGTRIDSATINGVAIPGAAGTLTPVVWNQLFNGGVTFDTARRNHLMYETPQLAGFQAQAAIGEDDFWDVALRYAGEFGGVRVAAGVGYSVDKEVPTFGPLLLTATAIKDTKGSASALHVASGLFVTVAGGMREIDWSISGGGATLSAKDAHFWHVAAGWQKNVSGMGNTVLYAEYQQAKDMMGYSVSGPFSASLTSDARMWGFGVVQHIDAAAMEVFLAYKNYSGEINFNAPGLNVNVEAMDFSAVIGGARVSF